LRQRSYCGFIGALLSKTLRKGNIPLDAQNQSPLAYKMRVYGISFHSWPSLIFAFDQISLQAGETLYGQLGCKLFLIFHKVNIQP